VFFNLPITYKFFRLTYPWKWLHFRVVLDKFYNDSANARKILLKIQGPVGCIYRFMLTKGTFVRIKNFYFFTKSAYMNFLTYSWQWTLGVLFGFFLKIRTRGIGI